MVNEPDFTVASLHDAMEIVSREIFRKSAERQSGNEQSVAATAAGDGHDEHVSQRAEPNKVPAIENPAARPGRPANPQAGASPQGPSSNTRVELLLEHILAELKRRRDGPHVDFSISKLLAGIVQILALAVFFMAYLYRDDPRPHYALFAIMLQTLTIALLIMGRQR
jgi:hypothetical protein